MEEIVRTPIKLRKPIQKDFCGCYDGMKVFAIEGEPQFIVADDMTLEDLENSIENYEYVLPVRFYQQMDEDNLNKAMFVLGKGIPVTVKTTTTLPTELVEKMTKVPHCGIQVSINSVDESVAKLIGGGLSGVNDLREMLFIAKSWKVFTSLSIEYHPHLISSIDILEIVEAVRNCISHVVISFPVVKDEDVLLNKTMWKAIVPSSGEKFKQYYTTDVPTRSWVIRDKYKKELMDKVASYLKPKKVTVDHIDHKWDNGRDRHIKSGYSTLPLGIHPFFYTKEDGKFVKVKQLEHFTCNKCGKAVFS